MPSNALLRPDIITNMIFPKSFWVIVHPLQKSTTAVLFTILHEPDTYTVSPLPSPGLCSKLICELTLILPSSLWMRKKEVIVYYLHSIILSAPLMTLTFNDDSCHFCWHKPSWHFSPQNTSMEFPTRNGSSYLSHHPIQIFLPLGFVYKPPHANFQLFIILPLKDATFFLHLQSCSMEGWSFSLLLSCFLLYNVSSTEQSILLSWNLSSQIASWSGDCKWLPLLHCYWLCILDYELRITRAIRWFLFSKWADWDWSLVLADPLRNFNRQVYIYTLLCSWQLCFQM